MDGAPATPVPGPARSGATYAKDDSVTLEDGLALWVPELKDQKTDNLRSRQNLKVAIPVLPDFKTNLFIQKFVNLTYP